MNGESDIVSDKGRSLRSRSGRVRGGHRQDSAVFAAWFGASYTLLVVGENLEENDGGGERLCYRVEQKAPCG